MRLSERSTVLFAAARRPDNGRDLVAINVHINMLDGAEAAVVETHITDFNSVLGWFLAHKPRLLKRLRKRTAAAFNDSSVSSSTRMAAAAILRNSAWGRVVPL